MDAKNAPRTLAVIAASLLSATALTGCVFVPAAVHSAEQPTAEVTEAPVAEASPEPVETTPEPTPTPEPVSLAPEDAFITDSMDALYLPALTPEMEQLMLEVGYSACDIQDQGFTREFIILVMEEAVADYPDVYKPRAASIITDAALTHLC